jgi:hypothetical protein
LEKGSRLKKTSPTNGESAPSDGDPSSDSFLDRLAFPGAHEGSVLVIAGQVIVFVRFPHLFFIPGKNLADNGLDARCVQTAAAIGIEENAPARPQSRPVHQIPVIFLRSGEIFRLRQSLFDQQVALLDFDVDPVLAAIVVAVERPAGKLCGMIFGGFLYHEAPFCAPENFPTIFGFRSGAVDKNVLYYCIGRTSIRKDNDEGIPILHVRMD